MEKRKENRNLKVYSSTTGYKRKETPMIMLKGAWLQELGFDSDTPISVKCEDGKITITPREPVKEVIVAVENAVAYDYSNGFVEGTNSRLKMIK